MRVVSSGNEAEAHHMVGEPARAQHPNAPAVWERAEDDEEFQTIAGRGGGRACGPDLGFGDPELGRPMAGPPAERDLVDVHALDSTPDGDGDLPLYAILTCRLSYCSKRT